MMRVRGAVWVLVLLGMGPAVFGAPLSVTVLSDLAAYAPGASGTFSIRLSNSEAGALGPLSVDLNALDTNWIQLDSVSFSVASLLPGEEAEFGPFDFSISSASSGVFPERAFVRVTAVYSFAKKPVRQVVDVYVPLVERASDPPIEVPRELSDSVGDFSRRALAVRVRAGLAATASEWQSSFLILDAFDRDCRFLSSVFAAPEAVIGDCRSRLSGAFSRLNQLESLLFCSSAAQCGADEFCSGGICARLDCTNGFEVRDHACVLPSLEVSEIPSAGAPSFATGFFLLSEEPAFQAWPLIVLAAAVLIVLFVSVRRPPRETRSLADLLRV